MTVDKMNKWKKREIEQIRREEAALKEKYSSDPAKVREKILALRKVHGFPEQKMQFKSFLRNTAILAVGLAAWYTYLGEPQNLPDITERYQLPAQIRVLESSVPYTTDPNGNRILQTKDIDFSSNNIDITTDRYGGWAEAYGVSGGNTGEEHHVAIGCGNLPGRGQRSCGLDQSEPRPHPLDAFKGLPVGPRSGTRCSLAKDLPPGRKFSRQPKRRGEFKLSLIEQEGSDYPGNGGGTTVLVVKLHG